MNIKIGPFLYHVLFDEARIDGASAKHRDRFYGEINFESHDILVRPSSHRSRQIVGLMHECLHGLTNLIDYGELPTGLTEEHFVTVLAPVLVQFIQDNPEVIAYIQGKAAG